MSDETLASAPGWRRYRTTVIGSVLIGVGLLGYMAWGRWQKSWPVHLREQMRHAAAEGRWPEVGQLSRQMTELIPEDGDAWLLRARAAQQQGDATGAEAFLLKIPAGHPQKMMALRGLAELQIGPLNHWRAAASTFHQMLQLNPQLKYAQQRLIFFYAMTFQRQELTRQARRAMELQCEPIESYVYVFFSDSLHFTNGAALNHHWLADDPNSELFTVAEAIHMASALQGAAPRDDLEVVRRIRRMADEKERVLAELFRKYPLNRELLAWQIDRAIELGDVGRVVDLLGKLPPEADDDNRFQRFAGWAHAQLGDEGRAQQSYNNALRLHPLDWSTRHLLADLRRQQQQFNEVDRLEKLAVLANELRRALDVLPDARSVPKSLLEKLADYAAQCGDELYARSLRRQLSLPPDQREWKE